MKKEGSLLKFNSYVFELGLAANNPALAWLILNYLPITWLSEALELVYNPEV